GRKDHSEGNPGRRPVAEGTARAGVQRTRELLREVEANEGSVVCVLARRCCLQQRAGAARGGAGSSRESLESGGKRGAIARSARDVVAAARQQQVGQAGAVRSRCREQSGTLSDIQRSASARRTYARGWNASCTFLSRV